MSGGATPGAAGRAGPGAALVAGWAAAGLLAGRRGLVLAVLLAVTAVLVGGACVSERPGAARSALAVAGLLGGLLTLTALVAPFLLQQ